MKKIIEFLDQIHEAKDLIFKQMIDQFEQQYHGKNHFNGDKFTIEGQQDFFLYLSTDKKEFFTSWGDYNPRIEYSYLVYFVFYLHKAIYTNGGLKFIGFYDKDYKRVDKIPLKNFSIVDSSTGCNFDNIKKPIFTFEIQNNTGNKHTSIRGNANWPHTCQKVIDFIWEIENYYSELHSRLIESPDYK